VACDYRPDHNLSPGREIPAVVHEGRKAKLPGFLPEETLPDPGGRLL